MLSPWHKNDYKKLPDEDKVIDVLRPLAIPPGDYMIPRISSTKEMKATKYIETMQKGPVGIISFWPLGQTGMGKELLLWFLYLVVIGISAAYIAGRALPPAASYLAVFHFAGITAFLGFAAALWQMSIWYRRPWSTTLKITIDGLVYALITAATFGWLWPN
jgi:hypothetical protein